MRGQQIGRYRGRAFEQDDKSLDGAQVYFTYFIVMYALVHLDQP